MFRHTITSSTAVDYIHLRFMQVILYLTIIRGKSGPALGGMEYLLIPSACRLIVRVYHTISILRAAVHQYESEV